MRVGVFYAYFPDGDPVNWPEVLRRAKEDGADHVELSSMRLLRQSREMRLATVETAKELGLTYSFCTSLPVNGDVASENIADQRRGIEAIKQNLELVAEMDGKVIGGMIHGSTNKPGVQVSNDTRQRRLENSARAVQEMGRTAESLGIRIGLEICNRYENTMLNTVDQGLVFLQMVDSPAVGLHLDTYHMNIEEDNLPDAIVKAGKSIVNVHACENNRKLPGMGHLDWPGILCALKEAGYTGSLATECFSIPYGCWINDHRLWRPYVRDGIDEDLKKSMRYLKALM